MKIPRRKQKIKYSRKLACKYLTPKGDISNSLQPLCFCPERDLVLGTKAYVCQVCSLYSQTNKKIEEIFEKSKKVAEKKIKDEKIEVEEFEISEIKADEEIDLSIDEFEEEDEEAPLKFEKRKAGKEDLEDSEKFGEIECPFCGELFENLTSHIQSCEFAPDDVSIEDVLPTKTKKKRKKRSSTKAKSSKKKQKCPYCGKEFIRLGRHLSACPNKPEDNEKEK